MFIERQRNIGQMGVEQLSALLFSPVLLHSSQQAFAVFAGGVAVAYDDRPVNMRQTAVRIIKAETFEKVLFML